MKDRLIGSGYTTTILGVCIIVFCGVLIYQGKQSASDMSGWLATGMLFLRSKDSILGIPPAGEE